MVKVNESSIRKLVRDIIDGVQTTVPGEKEPPVEPKRRDVKEAVDIPEFPKPTSLRKRQGRQGHISLRSTYDDKQMDLPSLHDIAQKSGVKVPGSESWLEKPFAGAPGARVEIERALDKIRMMGPPEEGGTPELVKELVSNIMKHYKGHPELMKSLQKVRTLIAGYKKRLIGTGNLEPEDVEDLNKPGADAAIYLLDGFQKLLASSGIKNVHRATFHTMARHGTLDMNDPRIDQILLNDPGFRVFLGQEKYWDWVRDAAEAAGLYKGQW